LISRAGVYVQAGYIPDSADLTDERPFVRVGPDVVLIVGILRERLLADLTRPLRRAGRSADPDRRRLGSSYRRRGHHEPLLGAQDDGRRRRGELDRTAQRGLGRRWLGLRYQRGRRLEMEGHVHVEVFLAAEVAAALAALERLRGRRRGATFDHADRGRRRVGLRCRQILRPSVRYVFDLRARTDAVAFNRCEAVRRVLGHRFASWGRRGSKDCPRCPHGASQSNHGRTGSGRSRHGAEARNGRIVDVAGGLHGL